MANKLYQELNNKPQMDFASFMQNPMQALMQKKINIPPEYQNNPQAAVQYLLNSGQMNQNAFNSVFGKLQKMGLHF